MQLGQNIGNYFQQVLLLPGKYQSFLLVSLEMEGF